MSSLKIKHSLKAFLLLSGTTIAFSIPVLHANAAAENATGIADPARIGQNLLKKEALPDLSPRIEVKPTEMQNAPEGAENIKLTLDRLEIEGVSAYKDTDLAPLYNNILGAQISLADLYALTTTITTKYRNDGYILTQVVIPPQTIENGIVKLRVVEGSVDQIIIEGETQESALKIIRGYAENLHARNILDAKELERYLLLINDLPGVKARSILSPSVTKTGTSDLRIIIERKPYDASVSFDNHGSRYLGPYQESFAGTLNSALGYNEKIDAQMVMSGDKDRVNELAFGSLSYEQPISPYGTTIKFLGSLTSTEPGYDLDQFDVQGMSRFMSATISHPFIRSRTTNFSGRATFDWRNVRSKNNIEPTRRDRIRSVRLGTTYQFMDTMIGVGINSVDFELSRGVDFFGASREGQSNLTRAAGNPKYTKAELQVQRLQRLTPKLNLLIAGQGQLAATPLLSSEEFGVGGMNIGQGYDSSEIVGDDGIAGKLELRWEQPKDIQYIDNYQLFGFVDSGTVWNQDATTSADKRDSLTSTGFGVRADVTEQTKADFSIAFPMTRDRDTTNSTSARYYFNVTHKF